MDRRRFIAGGLVLVPLGSYAQQIAKTPKVGVLYTAAAPRAASIDTLIQGLRDLGYIDKQNIALEFRSASGKPEAFPALAAELVRLDAKVMIAIGPAAIRAARASSNEIPIVAMDLESDPVRSGLVRSLARPGGNVTGLFLDFPELAAKWLELLKTAAPGIRRVGVLWDSTTGPSQLDAVKAAAPRYALDLQILEVRSADDFEAALKSALSGGSKAIVMLSSPIISLKSQFLADFTVTNRLSAISAFREFADVGGLMSYGPDLWDFYRRTASYVDKILRGAKPGDLPIEQPTKFELVINLKTAKALGLTIPQSLLVRANEVIQ
jgi:putative ABC transport system substrate-binding protein